LANREPAKGSIVAWSAHMIQTDVRRQVEEVLKRHDEIAQVLSDKAKQYSGHPRRALMALSRWFDRTSLRSEDLLSTPAALAICYPLLQSGADTTVVSNLTRESYSDAVRRGAGQYLSTIASRPRWFGFVLYPVCLLLICCVLLVAFSCLLAPDFERMFDEFGLALSAPTRLVLSIAKWVRDGWILLVIGAICVAMGLFWVSLSRKSFSLLDGCAGWTWHIAMLLGSGVNRADAIELASRSSGVSYIRQRSVDWVAKLRAGSNPFVSLTHINGKAVPTLAYALNLNQTPVQSRLLQDIALNYWDRDRDTTRWWFSMMIPLVICSIGTAVGFVVIALFLPLIQLINGLAS
jgi:hypothetical protein